MSLRWRTTHRLQLLLDLRVQGAGLDGDDLGRSVRVVGDGRAALRAENAMHGLAGAAHAGPALGRALDSQLVLGDDGDESCDVVNMYLSSRGAWGRREYSRSSRSGAGSRHSGRRRQRRACRRRRCR